jgi:hypothetical protein
MQEHPDHVWGKPLQTARQPQFEDTRFGPLKKVQMRGADEFPTEAQAAYAAGRERGGNEADGPFSAARVSGPRYPR